MFCVQIERRFSGASFSGATLGIFSEIFSGFSMDYAAEAFLQAFLQACAVSELQVCANDAKTERCSDAVCRGATEHNVASTFSAGACGTLQAQLSLPQMKARGRAHFIHILRQAFLFSEKRVGELRIQFNRFVNYFIVLISFQL